MNFVKQIISNNIKNVNMNISCLFKYYQLSHINTSTLGRWNSVIVKPKIEDNKYIDWGNIDNCCCSHNFEVKKINR